MTAFSDRLAHLVNTERMAAQHDPARIADLLHWLAHCASWTIAIEGRDDTTRADLAEGVCALIYDTATATAGIVSRAVAHGEF